MGAAILAPARLIILLTHWVQLAPTLGEQNLLRGNSQFHQR
jgi:hypothetical protein